MNPPDTKITFILPNYNTVEFLEMAYESIRRMPVKHDIVIMDDGSTDGSWEKIEEWAKTDDCLTVWRNVSGKILGHTITYDIAITKYCKTPIFSIAHSDMIFDVDYVPNIVKHLKQSTVVCGTRIEPTGIYPEGKEKILKPFGMYPKEFKKKEFEEFCTREKVLSKDQTTRGIFAPWAMYKLDFEYTLGGHEWRHFAPFPEEDASLFLRMSLAGFKMIQSRDALCWHWISRGHRSWGTNGIGNDGKDFKFYQSRARRNYLRQWNRWMQFDEYHHPLPHKVFDLVFDVDVTSINFLAHIEPWAQVLYVPYERKPIVDEYIRVEQPTTNIDLSDRIRLSPAECMSYHDIIVRFSQADFEKDVQGNTMILQNLNQIIDESVVRGKMELGIFKLTCSNKDDIAWKKVKVVNDESLFGIKYTTKQGSI